jgi:hypothetical protein
MGSSDMTMQSEWTMMPVGGLFCILVFVFLILGVAAFVKYLFLNRKR